MFIYSFKLKRSLRVIGWITLLIFLSAGIYFALDSGKTFSTEESVEVWQV